MEKTHTHTKTLKKKPYLSAGCGAISIFIQLLQSYIVLKIKFWLDGNVQMLMIVEILSHAVYHRSPTSMQIQDAVGIGNSFY